MRQSFLALLFIVVSLDLFADETIQFIENSVELDDPQAIGDTYSMAPLVESANGAAYLTPNPQISNHTFTNDGTVESGGFNLTGSVLSTSKFQVREFRSELGGGVSRYHVEMRAVNSDVAGTREPWVSSAFSGNEFIKWRLDVGSTAGGSDELEPGFAFAVVNSAANGYTTTGQPIGTSTFFDTSTTSGLSGVVQVFNGGSNIAGVGLAEIRMFWDIVASPDLEILSVDATDGAYLPGSTLSISIPMKNNGSVASGTTGVVSVYASTDNIISSGDTLLGKFNPDLAAGQQINYAGDFIIPPGLANGNYYIGAILDFPDPDLSNNSAFDPVTILISDQPDIRIRPLSLQMTEPDASPAQTSSNRETEISPGAYSETQLPLLIDRARNEGSVRVIVGFDSGSQAEGRLSEAGILSQTQVISDQGATLLNALQGMNYQENARYQFIPYMGLTVDASALQELAALPMVTSIEEDRLSAPHLDSSNPVIGSAVAWGDGLDGSGQTIAILDTGVDKSHPWFSTGGSKVVTESCYSSSTASSTSVCPEGAEESIAAGSGVHCSDAVDGCDHGTHVAGIAAGNSGAGTQFGVARGANIAAMQVFSVFPSADDCGDSPAPCALSYSSDQIKALERVFALRNTHNFAAVNMSLGGGQFFTSGACDAANVSLKAAIDELRLVGIATIISSGNDGYVNSVGAPACISSAVSVGNSTDSDFVAGTSNIYPEIDLLAPGTSITAAIPGSGTGVKSGTSMAAPHVAGAWAVLKQANVGSTIDDILTSLQSTGTAVDDQRSGGIEINIPRINLDLALGESLSSFGIINEGPVALTITSITRETTAPWISWSPAAPFTVQPGELKVITVTVDFDSAPEGTTQTRLLVSSNDANESPYPGGVLVNVTPLPGSGPGNIIVDKVTSPVDSSQIFNFTLTGAGVNQSFSLTHSATPYNSGDLLPTSENGTYNVAEAMPPGWTGSGSCSDGSPATAVDLAPGETVTCTFINTEERSELIYSDGFEEE